MHSITQSKLLSSQPQAKSWVHVGFLPPSTFFAFSKGFSVCSKLSAIQIVPSVRNCMSSPRLTELQVMAKVKTQPVKDVAGG